MSLEYFSKHYKSVLVFIMTFIIYGLSAGIKIYQQSNTPQYVQLANSFIHGRTDLISPERKFDLIEYQGKWYVPGGLAPALILIPFVALFGTGVSDVFFGVMLGTINTTLMYSLITSLTNNRSNQIWLTIFFAFGTVNWWVSSVGSVWLNAHSVALLFMILYVKSTLRENPWLAGLFLGIAALSRPPVMFSGLFFVLFNYSRKKISTFFFQKIAAFSLMFSIALVFMLDYNYLRFGNAFEFGYGWVNGTPGLTSAYSRGGGFNIKYMPCNIYVSLFGLPKIQGNPLPDINKACSHLEPIPHDFGGLNNFFNPIGMSIFFTSPAFLLIFRAKFWDDLVIPAWAGTLGVLLVLWMYHTTGWVQFGYRYSLDFIVFLFILLINTAKDSFGIFEKILICISVLMGGIGVYLIYYMVFDLIWYEMFLNLIKMVYRFVF